MTSFIQSPVLKCIRTNEETGQAQSQMVPLFTCKQLQLNFLGQNVGAF